MRALCSEFVRWSEFGARASLELSGLLARMEEAGLVSWAHVSFWRSVRPIREQASSPCQNAGSRV